MRQYTLWTLEENGCPREIKVSRNGLLDEQRQYKANLEAMNPKKVYWICEGSSGLVVF